MLFLLPIPVSLALAMLWAWWVSRPRPPVDATHSVEEWSRAVSALNEMVSPR